MQNFVDEFMSYMVVERNSAQNTILNYCKDIELFSDTMGVTHPQQITKHKIREFLAILADEGKSASTRNRRLASIRAFCKFLKEEAYIQTNPALEISTARQDKNLPEVFSIEDVNTMIQEVESSKSMNKKRDKAILETLYALGLRVSELVGLKKNDINFNSGIVRVRAEIAKGGRERQLPIHTKALETLKEYVDSRRDYSDFLFPSPVNQELPLTTRAVSDIVKKYAKNSQIAKKSPHVFRHSMATHLHANGVDIRDIQELLGHADISTTTVYTRVAFNHLAQTYHSAHPRG